MNKVKRIPLIFMVMLIMVIGIMFAATGWAEEKVVTEKIQSVVVKKDKRGQEYTQLWITKDSKLNGITFKKSFPIMAFGEAGQAAKHIKKGATVTMVVETGKYNNRETMTLLGIGNTK
jgi:hypothetical protein